MGIHNVVQPDVHYATAVQFDLLCFAVVWSRQNSSITFKISSQVLGQSYDYVCIHGTRLVIIDNSNSNSQAWCLYGVVLNEMPITTAPMFHFSCFMQTYMCILCKYHEKHNEFH